MVEEKKKTEPKAEKKAKGPHPAPDGAGRRPKGKTPSPEIKSKGQAPEEKQKTPKEKKPLVPRQKSPFELHYINKCVPALLDKFKYKNKMQVPKLEKIVINTCLKEALQDIKILTTAAEELSAITGQRPVIKKSKKSIANFKLRAGVPIAATLTLRGAKMYEFMSRFLNVALPRVRDFKGVPRKSFDGRGNYTLGLTEQTMFPEINFDKVTRVTGMNLTFVTTAKSNEEGCELLRLMGMPFRTI